MLRPTLTPTSTNISDIAEADVKGNRNADADNNNDTEIDDNTADADSDAKACVNTDSYTDHDNVEAGTMLVFAQHRSLSCQS